MQASQMTSYKLGLFGTELEYFLYPTRPGKNRMWISDWWVCIKWQKIGNLENLLYFKTVELTHSQ